MAAAIEAYNPVRRRSRNLDGLRKNVRQRDDGRWYWHWDPAFISNDDEPQRRIDRERLRRAASAITIPTLIVRGLQSDVVSDAGIADMRRLIPQRRSSRCRRPDTWSPVTTTTSSPPDSQSSSQNSKRPKTFKPRLKTILSVWPPRPARPLKGTTAIAARLPAYVAMACHGTWRKGRRPRRWPFRWGNRRKARGKPDVRLVVERRKTPGNRPASVAAWHDGKYGVPG